jgi:hypothetical protein
MVNGVNTLYEQKDEARLCSMWVLDPGESVKIDGFYVDETGDQNKFPFKALSDEESAPEFARNNLAGTITMHVFIEGTGPDRKEDVKTRGLPNGLWASNKRSIQTVSDAARVLTANQSKTRKKGLLAKGDIPEKGSTLTRVDFKDPQQKEAIFLRYYRPKKDGL